jgi:hypothetical protein
VDKNVAIFLISNSSLWLLKTEGLVHTASSSRLMIRMGGSVFNENPPSPLDGSQLPDTRCGTRTIGLRLSQDEEHDVAYLTIPKARPMPGFFMAVTGQIF